MSELNKQSATGRVTADYSSAYSSAYLSVTAGEMLSIGQRDPEWEGWIWCTNAAGQGGWVPEALLQIEGSQAAAQEDYIARELPVQAGDLLELHRLVSDWFWATNQRGESGWVPADNVDILPSI